MSLLERIDGPDDLRSLRPDQLPALAGEIRGFPRQCRRPHRWAPRPQPRGRRADHRDPPGLRLSARHRRLRHRAPVLRAQAAHRPQDFTGLRSAGGLSGYPSRAESPHDVVENSHATTALSWGATASPEAYPACAGSNDRHVVAVIGDGALTGGMAWEAINNIAADKDAPADHRGQRQRTLVRADHGRPGHPPRHAAHHPRLRALPVVGQADARGARLSSARRCTRPCTA